MNRVTQLYEESLDKHISVFFEEIIIIKGAVDIN